MQQALTTEAANVVKQAVTLARRRGHAQVTPLHVANTMLSSPTGLLRTACIQSHSHPLQCRALELCFNVALNRLPASTSSPIYGSHSPYPSISNALVAAFKRAQAHQRRGSIENQQQPLLTVKIELEQLIISILDDPSVSRVMREAGFSSTQVKSNVEQVVSLEICSQNAPPPSNTTNKQSSEIGTNNNNALVLSRSVRDRIDQDRDQDQKPSRASDPIRNEDVAYLIENLMSLKRKSLVVVGECISTIEGVVKEVMNKVDKKDVPEFLKEVKFITLSFSSFGHLNRLEVEQKLEDLKGVVRRCVITGLVLSLGDLKWAIEYRASSSEQVRGYYCPIEHMLMELGKLVSSVGENGKFWIIGIATFQTFMRCKSGHPSIESVLGLHPLTVPADSLRLSLITDSDVESQSTSKRGENGSPSWLSLEAGEGEETTRISRCADCSSKFEMEVRSLQKSSNIDSTSSSLPPWLQQCKDLKKDNHKDSMEIRDLCRKWNTFCNSVHKQPFSSISPSSSTSYHRDWPWRDHNHRLSSPADSSGSPHGHSLRFYIPEHNNDPKPSSSTPNSASSGEVMEMDCMIKKFKDLNAENLTTLTSALEKKVPWQKHIIPEIAKTVLECRSGMAKRKCSNELKEDTWLFFQGVDVEAKEKIAKELAEVIFDSEEKNFVTIALSSFSDSTEDQSRSKRLRDEKCGYIERFSEAVSFNPRRVFFVEDVEQADYCSQIGFKRAMERGKVVNGNGEEVGLADAIVVLSCESFSSSSRSRACSPLAKEEEERRNCLALDLNMSIDGVEDGQSGQCVDDVGLVEYVDRRFVFRIQEL